MNSLALLFGICQNRVMDSKHGYSKDLIKVLDEFNEYYEKISSLKLMEVIVDRKCSAWSVKKQQCRDDAFAKAFFGAHAEEEFLEVTQYREHELISLKLGGVKHGEEKKGYMSIFNTRENSLCYYFPEKNLLLTTADAIAGDMIREGYVEKAKEIAVWGNDLKISEFYRNVILEEDAKKAARKNRRTMKKYSEQIAQESTKDIEGAIEEYTQHMRESFQNIIE